MSACDQCEARLVFQGDISALKTNYDWLVKAVDAIQQSTQEIANSSKAMVRLEAEGNETRAALSRAFEAVKSEELARIKSDDALRVSVDAGFKDVADRLALIEREMPTLTLARTCVFGVIVLALTNMCGLVMMVLNMEGIL